MKSQTIIAIIVVALIGLGVGFLSGMQYQKSRAVQGRNLAAGAFQRNGMMFRQGFNQQNSRAVRGQIISMADDSVTVKLTDGSSRIVVLAGNTVYTKSQTASKTDLKTGDTIVVFGALNSDGSVTAQDVQINPLTISR